MTTEEAARILLPQIMSDISEETWSAGWLMGCEYRIWGYLQEESGWLTDEQRAVLEWLSEQAGGWFWWQSPEKDGPVFISRDAWLERYAAWQQEQAVRVAERASRGGEG